MKILTICLTNIKPKRTIAVDFSKPIVIHDKKGNEIITEGTAPKVYF